MEKVGESKDNRDPGMQGWRGGDAERLCRDAEQIPIISTTPELGRATHPMRDRKHRPC